MQSLKKRLQGRRDEILRFTKEKGRHPGQDYAGVKDFIAWIKWLERETGNPNFGLCPTNPTEVRTDSELLRAKAHRALTKLLSALDAISEGERQKFLAERESKRARFMLPPKNLCSSVFRHLLTVLVALRSKNNISMP